MNKIHSATEESVEEYQKAVMWTYVVLSIPTEIKSTYNDISKTLNTLMNNLKKHMYGMDHVIRHILQAVCVILTDPEHKGYILTLVRPPGVEKLLSHH